MSKVRDLPEKTSLSQDDLVYAVDDAAGVNGGRKVKVSTIKTAVELSAADVKTKYESNPDTNAFSDAEKTKLAGIEVGATADQSAAEVPYNNTVSGLFASNVQNALDELSSAADFRPSVVSGRILHYTGGTARFDDVFFELTGNDILLNPNITDGTVYVDLDGIVKQTASGIMPPPYTIVVAKFTTDLNNIVGLIDQRVKNSQNIVRGLVTDVRDIRAGALASAGASGRISDAMHKHNILTGAASTQNPDQANAEGVSINLARADHIHNIPTDAPVTDLAPSIANAEGVGTSFARNDHTHAIATGLTIDISTIHPNDVANAGVSDKFVRADHTHAIATAAPSTQNPDQANAEGVSISFARADHIHNIPTDVPVASSSNSVNTQGVSTSFARADHIHNITLANQIATSTTDDTTTSLTDVLMVNMSLSLTTGVYMCTWSGSIVNSAPGAERTWISFYLGGSQVTATERSIGTAGGAYVPSSDHTIITVTGTQALELRWRVAGGTSTVRSRRLFAVRIG